MLEVTKQEEKLTQKEDELKQVREKLDSQMRSSEEYERRLQTAIEEKTVLAEQLQAEVELCAEAEEMRARYETIMNSHNTCVIYKPGINVIPQMYILCLHHI